MMEGKRARSLGRLSMISGINDCFSDLQTPNSLFWDSNERRLYVSLTNAEVSKPFFLNSKSYFLGDKSFPNSPRHEDN
jgi:sugar lactone lactonase YvrE